jgi:hypothetical protein
MSDGTGWTPPVEPGAGPSGGAPQWGAPPGGGPAQPGYGGEQPGYGTAQPGQWGAPPGGPQGGPPGGPPGQWGQGQWGRQNAPWGQAPGYSPGVIPLRPLSLGEILDGAFTVIRHYPGVTMGLSAVVVTVTTLLQGALFWRLLLADIESVDGSDIGVTILDTLILSGISTAILSGMITSVVGDAVLGKTPTLRSTWAKVRPRVIALIVTGATTILVPAVALFALVVPGVFLWGAWSLATPALILERVGIVEALRRSWRLSVPDWWRVWGIRVLSVLVAAVLAQIIQWPFRMLGELAFGTSDTDTALAVSVVVMLVGGAVASAVTSPFTAGVLSLLYIDRRMRAEGLDVTLAQAAAQASATQAGTY